LNFYQSPNLLLMI